MENISLIERFKRHFEILPAHDEATRCEVMRLRHAVYCEELGYEPVTASGMETDENDEHSDFILMRHLATGRSAGCVRLIRHPGLPDWRFPFERACGERLTPDYMNPAQRLHAIEVSRLAVHQDFRRRRGEYDSPEGGGNSVADSNDRHFPLIAMGLFLAASALVLLRNVEQVYVMMEPRLARLLHSCGLHFTRVGELVEHHGARAPFRIQGEEIRRDLRADERAMQDFLMQALR
jgi:N-acyl amino acid synthase of PEP-CTERM/exosortase system